MREETTTTPRGTKGFGPEVFGPGNNSLSDAHLSTSPGPPRSGPWRNLRRSESLQSFFASTAVAKRASMRATGGAAPAAPRRPSRRSRPRRPRGTRTGTSPWPGTCGQCGQVWNGTAPRSPWKPSGHTHNSRRRMGNPSERAIPPSRGIRHPLRLAYP